MFIRARVYKYQGLAVFMPNLIDYVKNYIYLVFGPYEAAVYTIKPKIISLPVGIVFFHMVGKIEKIEFLELRVIA